MHQTPIQHIPYARAILRAVGWIIPVMMLVALVVTADGRWRAQTGTTMTGATMTGGTVTEENEDYKDYKEIEENKEINEDEEIKDYKENEDYKESTDDANQSSAMKSSSLSSLSSLSSSDSSSLSSLFSLSSLSSFASSSSSSSSSLSSLSSFALSLPSIHLIRPMADAPYSQHTPLLAIAKSGDFQESSDIVGKIGVTVTGSGKILATDLRMEETDEEILIYVETPAVFRPGQYDLQVTWTASRTDLRLMEKLFDRVSDGEETVLLEERIALGVVSLETERVQTVASTEGDLAVTRTSVVRTTPGAEETMTIIITPKASFVGSITEKVPAGFKVGSVTPFAQMTETEDGTLLSWNREFIGGTSLTLTYTFTTSPVAPLFAQFGPVEAKGSVTELVSEENVVEIDSEKEIKDYKENKENNDDANQSSAMTSSLSSLSSLISLSSFASSSSSSLSSLSSFNSSSLSSLSSLSSSAESTTGSDLSWFRRLLLLAQLSLQTGEPFRFTETHRWAMLIEPAEDTRVSRIGGAMLLEPLNGGVFDANTMPSFTLVETVLSGTGTDAIDAKGRFTEEAALTALVHALTDEKKIMEVALEGLLESRKEDIADAITNDSIAINTLLDGEVPRSAKRTAAAKAEGALKSPEKRKEASVILAEDSDIHSALDALVTADMEQKIVEQVIRVNAGKKATKTNDLLMQEAGKNAVTSATDVVTDAIINVNDIKQKLAEMMMKESKDDKENKGMPIIQVKLTNRNGETVLPKFHFVPGSIVLVIEPERAFTPGLYSLEVSVFNPLTNETQTQTADFAWGVLAMNAEYDRYQAGDIVQLAIGVLDDGGRIVCDAELMLAISGQRLAGSTEGNTNNDANRQPLAASRSIITLSTEDDSIETGTTCGLKEAGLIDPDYSTSFTAVEAGIYELTLTATTANGTRSMTSTIEVGEPPFLIRRIGATRLWPLAPSPMHITVTFNAPVTGTITETVPPDFVLSDIRPAASIHKNKDGSTELRWKGTWEEGEQATFRYLYDAPDISPQFYLLGPLRISSALPFLHKP